MDFNKFTIKSQEAIQKAQDIASSQGNQAIESIHILKGITEVDDNVLPFFAKQQNINQENMIRTIESIIVSLPKVSGAGQQYLSNDAKSLIQTSLILAQTKNDDFVSIEILLLAIASAKDNTSKVLNDAGLNKNVLLKLTEELRKGNNVNTQNADANYQALNRYAKNLNELAKEGKLDPVIGRDEEIRRVLQILSRRTKNNPILVGEPGVGKTAIAEGMAHRIINQDVPENLKSKIIFSLDLGLLIAGAKYKGEFEERLKSVVKEVVDAAGEIVLFIDEIHTLVGAGGGDGAMDAANILKPALARGELRAIGATTLKEYQKFFEKDKALERRFQMVMIGEPDTIDAISILRGLKERYEAHHKVRIKDEAIISAVELSQRYITDRFLPDKAIDLIDEAAAKLRLEIDSLPEELDELERKIRQLEIEREAIKREHDTEKVKNLSKEIANLNEQRNQLKAAWMQEKEIINQISLEKENIEEYKLDAERAERDGDYGKVAELRYGNIKQSEENIINLKQKLSNIQADKPLINEEVDSDEIAEVVARWTGIPVNKMLQSEREKLLHLEEELHKRVIGQDEAINALADAIRRSRAGLQDAKRPIGSFIFLGSTGVGKTELAKAMADYLFNDENSMVRIDMSEYQERHTVSRLIGAPPGYVGYEEGGQLTEAVRRKPYSVILLDEIEKAHPDVFNILLQVLDDGRLTDNKGRIADFKNTIIILTSNIGSHLIMEKLANGESNDNPDLEETEKEVYALLKKSIRPEFLNRIDETIMFKPLNQSEIKDVVRLQFNSIVNMLKKESIDMEITEQTIDKISKLGYDPQYGARPVKRVIQRQILNELSKMILAGKVNRKHKIIIDYDGNKFLFNNN